MADSTRVNDIQDKILEAIRIISQRTVDGISYDQTIVGKITDDTYKKDGKYEIDDGSVIFTAYSDKTDYRKNTSVYVTIPQGNWDSFKIITGKVPEDGEQATPFTYTSPFDQIFDLTGNLADPDWEFSLLANGEKESVLMSPEAIKVDLPQYDYLAIKADFQSWVKEAISGDYGIEIKVVLEQYNTTQSTEAIIEQEKTFYLNTSEMFGNPYNFETYYSQEAIVPLKELNGRIKSMQVAFYQSGDFKDQKGKSIESTYVEDEDGAITKLPNNLFVKNIYICCGFDINEYKEEYVNISTTDSMQYNKLLADNTGTGNEKHISLKWIHLDGDTRINMSKFEDTEGKYPYEIRWYRYSIGAPAADEYSGVYWQEIPIYQEERYQQAMNDFADSLKVIQENNALTDSEKEERTQELTANLKGILEQYKITTSDKLVFSPDVNNSVEKIKVIILIKNAQDQKQVSQIYRSNTLIFENENEVPNKATIEFQNALEIECEDGSNGNYMYYGQDDYLIQREESDIVRSLKLKFKPDEKTEAGYLSDEQYADVKWNYPKENSMMSTFDSTNGKLTYKIENHFSHSKSNNTIVATFTINNITYTTEKEMTFGQSGTMGTEQALVIDYIDDRNAITITEGETEEVQLQLQIYDKSNNKDISNNITGVSWYLLENVREDKNKAYTIKETIYEGQTERVLTLKLEDFDINTLYIIKAKCGTLETYFPLALRTNSEYTHIAGPTQVIYQTNGEPKYSTDAYVLYKNEIEETNVEWQIKCADEDINFAAKLKDNKLQPIQMYLEDSPIYGVQAIVDKKPVWTQPILVLQNRWPNAVINQWDGNETEIDNGYILTPAIAAGKKNAFDNSFSGVMIGDWANVKTEDGEGSNKVITRNTGVYGFHEGQMAYALKDDGTAFIGKSGKGRIEFNGNSSIIKDAGGNMSIDLDDGLVNAKNFTLYAEGDGGEITLTSTGATPLKIGENFYINWDGSIYATKGQFTGNINASTISSDTRIEGSIIRSDDIYTGYLRFGELSVEVGTYFLYIAYTGIITPSGQWETTPVLTGTVRDNNTLKIGQSTYSYNLNMYDPHGIIDKAATTRKNQSGTLYRLVNGTASDSTSWSRGGFMKYDAEDDSLKIAFPKIKFMDINDTNLETYMSPNNQYGIYARFA